MSVSLLQKWQVLQAALADAKLSTSAKVVLARLLGHHNAANGRCNPSYQTLADGTGLKRRAAIYAVQELEAAGWLLVDRVKGGDPTAAKGFVTNGFRIDFGRASAAPPVHAGALPPGAPNDTPPGAPLCTPPVQNGALPQCTLVHSPPVHGGAPKHGKEESGKRTRESLPHTPIRFPAWWYAYPRKVGRVAAERKFERIIASGQATAEELIAGAERYAAEREDEDPKFTKHPKTWLHQGCWTDEAPPPPSALRNHGGRPRFSATERLVQRIRNEHDR